MVDDMSSGFISARAIRSDATTHGSFSIGSSIELQRGSVGLGLRWGTFAENSTSDQLLAAPLLNPQGDPNVVIESYTG